LFQKSSSSGIDEEQLQETLSQKKRYVLDLGPASSTITIYEELQPLTLLMECSPSVLVGLPISRVLFFLTFKGTYLVLMESLSFDAIDGTIGITRKTR